MLRKRKRFQRGSVCLRKHGGVKVWVGQWRENDQGRSRVLGRFSQMTKVEALNVLTAILKPINENTFDTTQADRTLRFGEYVKQKYLPHCKRTWKESTAYTSQH